MADFKANQKLDHVQLIESLSQIQESQALLQEKTDATNDLVRQMMAMFQTVLSNLYVVLQQRY